jgi:hypothetical protein
MVVAEFKLTENLLTQEFRRYRRQHRGRFVMLAIKVLALLILAPIATLLCSDGYILVGVLFAVLAVFMLFAHWVDHWWARRAFRKSPFRDTHVRIEFREDGFYLRTDKSEGRLDWSLFSRVVRFADGFLLLRKSKGYSWIPLDSLTAPSAASDLEEFLKRKITEYKVV